VRFERTATARALRDAHDAIEPGAETGVKRFDRRAFDVAPRARKLGFGEVRDATGDLQIMCALDKVGADTFALWEELDLGDWIGVEGEVIKTRKGELTVRAARLQLLAKDIRPFPRNGTG